MGKQSISIDKETDEVTQEVVGSFKQYPVRLAWAITIHKSQGLTFDKAVVDIGDGLLRRVNLCCAQSMYKPSWDDAEV